MLEQSTVHTYFLSASSNPLRCWIPQSSTDMTVTATMTANWRDRGVTWLLEISLLVQATSGSAFAIFRSGL
jgi:hypothetical protein